MSTKRFIIFVTLLIALFAGCNKDQSAMVDAPAPSSEMKGKSDSASGPTEPGIAPSERMVIKNANLTIEHDAPQETSEKALAIVAANGGFVVDNTTQNYNESTHVSMTLRIPSASFETTVQQLRELGEVRTEAITGEDVTEEFMDLQAQLRNQRALESRFVELLGQAATVAETIEVERELARVRTEVERLEGRSQFLNDRVSMSTIALEIRPTSSFGGTTTIGKEVADAFGDAGEIIAVVIGGLIRMAAGLLPIGVALALLILVFRGISRRRKRGE